MRTHSLIQTSPGPSQRQQTLLTSTLLSSSPPQQPQSDRRVYHAVRNQLHPPEPSFLDDSIELSLSDSAVLSDASAHVASAPASVHPSSDFPDINEDDLDLAGDRPHGRSNRRVTRLSDATASDFARSAQRIGTARLQAARTRAPALPNRPRAPRKEWTAEEVGALILYITRWGPAWSRIKQYDDGKKFHRSFLQRRSQVDLKDKARNIKYTMLRDRCRLHENWRGVTLGDKKKDMLQRFGVSDFWEESPTASRAE
jgi:hypothetical protein